MKNIFLVKREKIIKRKNMNKRIALVAHDNRKKDLAEWISFNAGSLMNHKMICTGTTGKMIEKILKEKMRLLDI